MGNSDGRRGTGAPQASATSSPMTAEDAERFASVLKPMWELDSSPQPAAPPPPKPRAAPPVVTVRPRHVNATMPYPALLAGDVPPGLSATSTLGGIAPPPPSPMPLAGQPGPATRDSSHEFDEFVTMPRASAPPPGGSPAVAATAATAVTTVPAPPTPAAAITGASDPLNASAVAVEAHLPPRRQQVSEPSQSIQVDAAPAALPTPVEAVALAEEEVVVSFGPTPEELKARAARRQPTMVISKAKLAKIPKKKSRAPLAIGVALLLLAAGGAGFYAYTTRAAAEHAEGAAAASPSAASLAAGAPSVGAAAAPSPSPTSASPGTASSASAGTSASPASSSASATSLAPTIAPSGASASSTSSAASAASAAHAAHKPHGPKTPGGIVRASPY